MSKQTKCMSPFEARRLEVRDCVTGDTETKFVIRTRRHSSWRTKGVRAHNRKPECPALIGMHKGKSWSWAATLRASLAPHSLADLYFVFGMRTWGVLLERAKGERMRLEWEKCSVMLPETPRGLKCRQRECSSDPTGREPSYVHRASSNSNPQQARVFAV